MTWHKALHDCTLNGMRLASIASEEEDARLVKQIKDSGMRFDAFSLQHFTSHSISDNIS